MVYQYLYFIYLYPRALLQNRCTKQPPKSEPIMKKLADRLSVVKIKKSSDVKSNTGDKVEGKQTLEYDVMENNAFRMIGDDDL